MVKSDTFLSKIEERKEERKKEKTLSPAVLHPLKSCCAVMRSHMVNFVQV